MTTNAHTPTPWEVGDLDHNGQRIVRGEHIEICTCWHHSVGSIEREMEANAAFIVRAVNAHEQLVAALKCALGHMTGNMDGDWSIASDPIALAHSVLAGLEG